MAFQQLFGISENVLSIPCYYITLEHLILGLSIFEKGGLKRTWRNMWKLWFVLLQADERTKQGIQK